MSGVMPVRYMILIRWDTRDWACLATQSSRPASGLIEAQGVQTVDQISRWSPFSSGVRVQAWIVIRRLPALGGRLAGPISAGSAGH